MQFSSPMMDSRYQRKLMRKVVGMQKATGKISLSHRIFIDIKVYDSSWSYLHIVDLAGSSILLPIVYVLLFCIAFLDTIFQLFRGRFLLFRFRLISARASRCAFPRINAEAK